MQKSQEFVDWPDPMYPCIIVNIGSGVPGSKSNTIFIVLCYNLCILKRQKAYHVFVIQYHLQKEYTLIVLCSISMWNQVSVLRVDKGACAELSEEGRHCRYVLGAPCHAFLEIRAWGLI